MRCVLGLELGRGSAQPQEQLRGSNHVRPLLHHVVARVRARVSAEVQANESKVHRVVRARVEAG